MATHGRACTHARKLALLHQTAALCIYHHASSADPIPQSPALGLGAPISRHVDTKGHVQTSRAVDSSSGLISFLCLLYFLLLTSIGYSTEAWRSCLRQLPSLYILQAPDTPFRHT